MVTADFSAVERTAEALIAQHQAAKVADLDAQEKWMESADLVRDIIGIETAGDLLISILAGAIKDKNGTAWLSERSPAMFLSVLRTLMGASIEAAWQREKERRQMEAEADREADRGFEDFYEGMH